MPNGKTSTARRREVRRNVPRPGPKWVQFLRRKEVDWAGLFIVLFTLVGSLIVISASIQQKYRVGQTVTKPIVSRVEFKTIDQIRTQEEKKKAGQRIPPVYTANEEYWESLLQRLTGLISLADYETIEQVPADNREQINLTQYGLAQLKQFLVNEKPSEEWKQLTRQFVQGVFNLAILNDERLQLEKQQGYARITIIHPDPSEGENKEQFRYDYVLISVNDQATLQEHISRLAIRFPRPLQENIIRLLMHKPEPTYHYNLQLTEYRRREAHDNQPPVEIKYKPNEILIPANKELTAHDLELIKAEHREFITHQTTANKSLKRIGLIGIVLMIGIGYWSYIFAYNEKIVRNPMRGLAITALLLLCQAIAVALTQMQVSLLYVSAVIPTLMATIILAIAYNQRFALGIGAIHTLLVMISLDLPVGFGLVLLTGVSASVAQLHEVRNRSKLVQVGIWSGLAMGMATFLIAVGTQPLYISDEIKRIGIDCALAVSTGLITGLITQGILPVIEQVFKVTTAMTLKELNDASHPLLQRLAQEAPGTYQHSLRIADMAEAAAESISADGLACRVGSMYHDVGKINKPMYFIENQGGGPNRHNKLSPAMSLLIIVGHVKDGIEMAREYGLPSVLRHFIESHHGTTLVEYFYHAAKKQKEAEAKPEPSEFEFRYSGPKPQTKEAAIMLLCDGIEGAARALSDPTPIRLEQIVHNMANKRLMDGKFDECNLTLQELSRIEQSITKTLCAIYHSRIKYPDEKEDEEEEFSQVEPDQEIA